MGVRRTYRAGVGSALTAPRAAVAAALVSLAMLTGCEVPSGSAADEERYAIEMFAVTSASWDALRYDTSSGRTWRLIGGRWEPIPEAGPVPSGTYRLETVALANDWGALRLDVGSGRTWAVREGAWVEIQE